MNILVALRLAVDIADEVPIVDGSLDEDEVQFTPNEYDEYALEEALRLKGQHGDTVVAAASERAGNRILHTALARGADQAVRLAVQVPLVGASLAESAAFEALANDLAADLVLVGVQAPDDIFGQLAPLLAGRLGWPQISGVTAVEHTGTGTVTAVQELEGGRSVTFSVTLPAVLGIQASRQQPGYVSATKLKQVMQGAKIESRSVASAPESRVRLADLAPAPLSSRAEMLSDDADTAASEIASLIAAQ